MTFPIAAVLGAVQLVAGVAKSFKKRPKYSIPTAQSQGLAIAKMQAQRSEAPGESIARARIAQQGANSIAAAREYGMAGLAALPAIQANMQAGQQNIDLNALQWRDRQTANYLAALNRHAQYEDQAWQINQFAPYADNMQRSQNLIGGGITNIASGYDSSLIALLAKSLGGSANSNTLGGTM